jgi:hypothetical protein
LPEAVKVVALTEDTPHVKVYAVADSGEGTIGRVIVSAGAEVPGNDVVNGIVPPPIPPGPVPGMRTKTVVLVEA